MNTEEEYMNEVIILRCCRDWPIHRYYAYGTKGRCGICRESPVIVEEPYPVEKYAKNMKEEMT